MLDLDDGTTTTRSLALARKWRPQNFAAITGQEHAVLALTGALKTGRLHHAFMFTGTRGIGKTTLARIMAKAFNCTVLTDGEPCGKCDHCQQVEQGVHPDVIEMDAASTTQVDNMRNLLESANYSPAFGRCKIYIIDEVHMLSRHSFNAMLKTLEEPPEHVKFILATTDPQQVPATVQSRCLRFSLRRLEVEQLVARLEHIMAAEGQQHEDGALAVIAEHADGSMRDALSILDEALASGGPLVATVVRSLVGAATPEQVPALLEHVLAGNVTALLEHSAAMHQEAVSLASVCGSLVRLLHEAQLAALAPELAERAVPAVRQAAQLDQMRLQVAYEVACQGHIRLATAPHPKIAFDMTLLRMVALLQQHAATPSPSAAAVPPPISNPVSANPAPASIPNNMQQWQQLCANLGGPAQTLARECTLASRGGNTLCLHLAQDNEYLLRHQPALAKALVRAYGKQVRIVIKQVARTETKTPAQLQKTATEDAAREATLALTSTELATKVKEAFPDSKVVPGSVRRTTSDNDSC